MKTKKISKQSKTDSSITAPTAVMIATPMYGGMCTGPYMSGMLSTQMALQYNNIPMAWTYLMNESLITRARNELVRIFLETENFTHLMFIDADISFQNDAVLRLIAADKDVVCGVYPKKEIDWVRIEQAAKQGYDNLKDYGGAFVLNVLQENKTTDHTGAVEVRHGGTGFMLIKRQVFEKLKDHVPTYRTATVRDEKGNYVKPLTHEYFATSIDSDGTLLSEDYHFCELWRNHGGKIHLNPFIKLEHIGTYIYSGDILRAGGNIK